MGADTFETYAEGTDIAKAFQSAIEEAQHEHGNRGYTGSIAEKDSYAVIEPTPMTPDAAKALAKKLMCDYDERISDKRGPAGAIAVRGGPRTLVRLPIPERDGGYADLRSAAAAAAPDLADGEVIVDVPCAQYERRRGGGVSVGVVTTGSPEQTGWLFFGSAPR